nr:MAG TPA: hypothetical protein [Caudoviricetes sp.]
MCTMTNLLTNEYFCGCTDRKRESRKVMSCQ